MVVVVVVLVFNATFNNISVITDEGMFPLFTHLSADYRLRHLVNKVAIHIYTHDYIRMEMTVLYLKISRQQLSIKWSQISVYWLRLRVASKLNLRPSNLQLMP
jgi:hypothetical protein